jgi:hypothetical protein
MQARKSSNTRLRIADDPETADDVRPRPYSSARPLELDDETSAMPQVRSLVDTADRRDRARRSADSARETNWPLWIALAIFAVAFTLWMLLR